MTERKPPVYEHPPEKTTAEPGAGRHLSHTLSNLHDGVLFWAAAVATIMLAAILARQGLVWSWWAVAYFLALWAVTSYLALPRLHLALTSIYVPHYFIARTRTGDGLLGDPVNLAADGTEAQIHEAMRAAGWMMADPINLSSSLRMVTSSLFRRSYPEAPVSSLYLFERRQDFAYQMEVEGNPAQRHHVRFWQCPHGWLLPGGERVGWLAAGTYDRSVGLSLFTLQVTHKIDADIDIERDFIVDSVLYAKPDARLRVIEGFSTGYHSRNGGGDVVRTDGDLPILQVQSLVPSDEAIRVAEETGDLLEPAPEEVGKRPASVVVGVLATLLTFVWEVIDVIRGLGELDAQLEFAGDSVDDDIVTFAVVAIVVGTVAALNLVLAWKTYQGRGWARRWMTTLTTFSVLFSLWGLMTASPETEFWTNMVATALGVIVIYAFTGSSARDWERCKRVPVTSSVASSAGIR